MKKEKVDIAKLKKDIENAEKYFDRSGKAAKEAFDLLNEEITENDSVTQTVYLYIPGTIRDNYDIFLN